MTTTPIPTERSVSLSRDQWDLVYHALDAARLYYDHLDRSKLIAIERSINDQLLSAVINHVTA